MLCATLGKTRIYLLASVVFVSLSLCTYSQEYKWRYFGDLPLAVYGHGFERISESRVLVIGGLFNGGGPANFVVDDFTAECSIIDVDSQKVLPAAPMRQPRAFFATCKSPDGKVLVTSGLVGNSPYEETRECELYDPATNRWEVVGSLRFGRWRHTAIFLDSENVLVVGGQAGVLNLTTLNSAEIFNIRTGASTLIDPYHFPANNIKSGISRDGTPLVFAGRSGAQGSYNSDSVMTYDLRANRYVRLGSMPNGLTDPPVLKARNGQLYYSGGYQESIQSPVRAICLERGYSFVRVGTLATARHISLLEQLNDTLLVTAGGVDARGVGHISTEFTDVTTGISVTGPNLLNARVRAGSATLRLAANGRLYPVVFGGINETNRINASVEILEPVVTSPPPRIVSEVRDCNSVTLYIEDSVEITTIRPLLITADNVEVRLVEGIGTRSGRIEFSLVDTRVSGRFRVLVANRSGLTVERSGSISPGSSIRFMSGNALHRFVGVAPEVVCDSFVITNVGLAEETVHSANFDRNWIFSASQSQFPVVVSPGERVTLHFCVDGNTTESAFDTLRLITSCETLLKPVQAEILFPILQSETRCDLTVLADSREAGVGSGLVVYPQPASYSVTIAPRLPLSTKSTESLSVGAIFTATGERLIEGTDYIEASTSDGLKLKFSRDVSGTLNLMLKSGEKLIRLPLQIWN